MLLKNNFREKKSSYQYTILWISTTSKLTRLIEKTSFLHWELIYSLSQWILIRKLKRWRVLTIREVCQSNSKKQKSLCGNSVTFPWRKDVYWYEVKSVLERVSFLEKLSTKHRLILKNIETPSTSIMKGFRLSSLM